MALIIITLFVDAQDCVSSNGFVEDFTSIIEVQDEDSRIIDWWGHNNVESSYSFTRDGSGDLVVSVNATTENTWKPFGFAVVSENKEHMVDISSSGIITVSYTNSSENTVEVYWEFAFLETPSSTLKYVNATNTGEALGGVIQAKETKNISFDLNDGQRTSWNLSESTCGEKNGLFVGGKCIWDDNVNLSKFDGVGLTITGVSGTPLKGETVTLHQISAGNCSSSCVNVLTSDTITFQVTDTKYVSIQESTFLKSKDTVAISGGCDSTHHSYYRYKYTVAVNDTVVHNIYDTTAITVIDTNFVTKTNYVNAYDSLIVDLTGVITTINAPFTSNMQVKVFPNPASQLLFLEVLDAQVTSAYSFELVSVNGSIVADGLLNSNTTTIDISSYSGGTYYVKFYDAQQRMVNQAPVVIRK